MPTNQRYIDFAAAHPKVEMGVILSAFSSMGIGGPADLYYRLEKSEDLESLIKTAARLGIPYFVLGGGTNTVFADEGFRGLVIHFMARKVALEEPDAVGAPESGDSGNIGHAHKILSADAGALLSQVIAFALKNNLAGLEKMMGVPGTIGGAVRGNAGAHGTEIKDVFHKALVYSQEKGLFSAGARHFDFSYRHSTIKHSEEIIIKVFLRLEEQDCSEAIKTGTEIITKRIIAQPKGRSTGSFFKNPGSTPDAPAAAHTVPTDATSVAAAASSAAPAPHAAAPATSVAPAPTSDSTTPKESKAGYLLEQCGCKGLTVGGAQVSSEHANWIMNQGNATQNDLLELARTMQKKVKERFNITLETEVQLVGPNGFIKL